MKVTWRYAYPNSRSYFDRTVVANTLPDVGDEVVVENLVFVVYRRVFSPNLNWVELYLQADEDQEETLTYGVYGTLLMTNGWREQPLP